MRAHRSSGMVRKERDDMVKAFRNAQQSLTENHLKLDLIGLRYAFDELEKMQKKIKSLNRELEKIMEKEK